MSQRVSAYSSEDRHVIVHPGLAIRLGRSLPSDPYNLYPPPPLLHFQCQFPSPPLDQLAKSTYPEVQIQVSTASKLPVADLEGDGHPVVGVQHLMETLARVGSQLHVVRETEHHA
jgi:hypothetical protein